MESFDDRVWKYCITVVSNSSRWLSVLISHHYVWYGGWTMFLQYELHVSHPSAAGVAVSNWHDRILFCYPSIRALVMSDNFQVATHPHPRQTQYNTLQYIAMQGNARQGGTVQFKAILHDTRQDKSSHKKIDSLSPAQYVSTHRDSYFPWNPKV